MTELYNYKSWLREPAILLPKLFLATNKNMDANEREQWIVLEHHAGADKALAQLIKMKQDSRKASQSEREQNCAIDYDA